MEQEYKHILVAIDGSTESELAFQKAVQVAIRNEATLLLVQVIDPIAFQSFSGSEELMNEQVIVQISEQVKGNMEDYLKTAKELGVKNVSYTIE